MNLTNTLLSFNAQTSNITGKEDLMPNSLITETCIPLISGYDNLTVFGVTVLSILAYVVMGKIVELGERIIADRRMNALYDEVMAIADSQERRNIEDIIHFPATKENI